MENTVEARWKKDEKHLHRPDWATTRTPLGWSDAEHRNSRGEKSLIGLEERLGDGSVLTSQPTIPIWLTNEQKEAMEKASPEELKKLDSYTKNQMRVDALLDNNALGIPIYIEIDGRQHERNAAYKGISQSHLDRIKDFCSRLNQGALMIRVRSDERASEKVERIYGELRRYDETLDENDRERRSRLQEYADALCYGFASKTMPEDFGNPELYIYRMKRQILRSLIDKGKLNGEQVKLLNTWARRRSDLYGFAKVFRDVPGEKTRHFHEIHGGDFYYPYRFIEGVLRALRARKSVAPQG